MIPLNTEQRLSATVFWYSAIPSIVLAFIAVIAGAFVKDLVLSSCAMSACPAYVPFLMPVIVLAFIAAVLAHPILSFVLFSYRLTEHSITISSGILYRQYETIDFSRIQTFDLERGPILWLFGLTEVRLWTASSDQLNTSDIGTKANPDTTMVLPKDTAVHLRDFVTGAKQRI
jgi:membrane protein YdbS with pleckstrin-like domain